MQLVDNDAANTYDGGDVVMSSTSEEDEKEYPCLIRATDGKHIEFSTHVQPKDLEKFHAIYGSLLKASMLTLRKRDKKREKLRAEQQAAKKRKLAEPIVIRGPKRGNGRRKRQRLIKAASRQEEARKKAAEKESAKEKS
ncbi:hypothetical protein Clacol_007474 [Clathrus columnatus]|uniref:Signal recognition particle subunit SRP14 n=1 Tax=Clathrus columnatus TaxID=1419009 RepID=A0AAV5AJD7_9AGAM|nr:hypothetical protein Clacol_007474 [Clathrus columnatus]